MDLFMGILKGFDQATNIILDESHERLKEGVQQLVLGLLYCISVVGEINHELDESLDLSSLRAHPLKPQEKGKKLDLRSVNISQVKSCLLTAHDWEGRVPGSLFAMAEAQANNNFITCKAAVPWAAGEPLVMEEVVVSPPQPHEIRIKVVSTSLCRSDISAWQSHSIFPRIFGHEASGIVESVGQQVIEFKQGDHVLTVFTGECGRCRQCTSAKKSNLCQHLGLERRGVMHTDQKTRFSIKATSTTVYHYCAVSSFSEYTVVHSGCAVKVPPSAPLDKICLLSCGLSAGKRNINNIMPCILVHTSSNGVLSFCYCRTWNVADVSKGSSVVIFGLGTVGLAVAQGANLRGASQIIGVDINPEKCEMAMAFGITKVVNPNDYTEPIQQVIKRLTDGGADYSFECIGDTEMVTTALQSCSDGWGLTVTLGVPKDKPEILTHYELLLTGRKLTGSLFGGWKPKTDLPSLVDMYLKKEIQVDEFITHDLEFEDINNAFKLMTEGRCLRCVGDHTMHDNIFMESFGDFDARIHGEFSYY
ncbi:hypothetical protein ACFE04_017898 [Oxalis oulophora]